jgi:hypothetical protein
LAAVLGPDGDADSYWDQATANLKAGRIRLVFVADEIPRELRRVVEFPNEQIAAEVIAIEVKQYVGPEGLRTLVPRVIGQTARAGTGNGPREKRQWDEPSFFQELKTTRGPDEARVARELFDWARRQMSRIDWGSGKVTGWFIPVLDHAAQPHYPFGVSTYGRIEIYFQYMTRPPFDEVELRRELRRRLNDISGVSIPEDAIRPAEHPAGRLRGRLGGARVAEGGARLVLRHGAIADGELNLIPKLDRSLGTVGAETRIGTHS